MNQSSRRRALPHGVLGGGRVVGWWSYTDALHTSRDSVRKDSPEEALARADRAHIRIATAKWRWRLSGVAGSSVQKMTGGKGQGGREAIDRLEKRTVAVNRNEWTSGYARQLLYVGLQRMEGESGSWGM